MPLDGILLDVLQMHFIIPLITNAVITEATLPNREARAELLANRMGGSALDQLHGALQTRTGAGTHQNVEVIAHQDKSMDLILADLSMVEQVLNKDFACLWADKYRTTLQSP